MPRIADTTGTLHSAAQHGLLHEAFGILDGADAHGHERRQQSPAGRRRR
jgi:hypothetical protein